MSTAVVTSDPRISLAESFREPGQVYLSPHLISEALGVQVQTLAQRAHVSRNIPAASPKNERLQQYLRDVVRVLAAAESVSGDRSKAVFWFLNEPLPEFDYTTPEMLIRNGKVQVALDYIASIAGGASG